MVDFLILLIPTPLVLALFAAAASLLLRSFLKYFFVFVYVIFVHYSKRCSKNIRDSSKIEMMTTLRYNYSKGYNVGRANPAARCNRSVITRRNLAVSDIYMSVFGKYARHSLFVLSCRYSRSQATHR